MASAATCESFKGALAKESGNIQALIQWKLKSYSGFALNVVKETDYDARSGENPRSIRYRKARVRQENYVHFLNQGSETRQFESEACDGSTEILEALAAKNSQCEVHGTKVHMGYEEFQRAAKRTAIESEIICILTILEKKAPGEYLRALREAMVESAIERYEREVLTDFTNLAHHKTAVTAIYHQNEGSAYFPAMPEGVLNIGTLKRLADRMDAWNYFEGASGPMVNGEKAMTVYCGRTAMEQAIENHLKSKGVQRTMNYVMVNDPKFGQTMVYEGIQFIVNKKPTRGWLRKVQSSPELYEFVEVLPTKNVVAGGEGIFEEPNEDYYNCYTTCEGRREKLYEIGYIPHPNGMERQRFQIPMLHEMFSKMGAKYSGFDVRYLNGTLLWDGCGPDGEPVMVKNEDQLKAKMKINHAYAPFSFYPEKLACILYQASPDPIEVYDSTCVDECTDDTDTTNIGLDEHPALDQCNDCSTTLREEDRDPLFEERSASDPYPTNGAGTIRLKSCDVSAGIGETTLTLCVERVGGDVGEASILLNSANGTATAGVDYTAVVNEEVLWEDGCSGVQCIEITLAGIDASAGKVFTVVMSVGGTAAPNVAVLDGNCTANTSTVTFEDPSDCETVTDPCGC